MRRYHARVVLLPPLRKVASMNGLMTAPGALRSNGGEITMRSTMGLEAHALGNGAVRIVMVDTLPGGSEMEVTFAPEQAASFASRLHELAAAVVEGQETAAGADRKNTAA